MQAVLYVGHGSRMVEGNQQLIQFIEQVKQKMTFSIQEIAFLEKTQPTVREGMENCIAQGATSITIVPIFLLAAGHVKLDLPSEITRVKEKYPNLSIFYGEPIGPDYAVIDILFKRLCEQGFSNERQQFSSDEDVSILLVGRGSSDPSARQDLVQIATMLAEKCHLTKVYHSFLAASEPTFTEGLEKVIASNCSKVFVIPYLLFTGILMKRMEKTIADYRERSTKDIVLTSYLGYHPKLVDIIIQRTENAHKLG